MNIIIVGATGAVGQEVIRLVKDFFGDQCHLRLLASAKSVGKELAGQQVELLDEMSFEGASHVIFSASSDVSKKYVPYALKAGAVVIDNSSAFRQDPGVPLIIPEINGHLLEDYPKLIANPNCSTIIALMVLAPLHAVFGLKRFIASTYQAVSGAGIEGIDALYGRGNLSVFPETIIHNVIPQIEAINPETFYTYEEEKMLYESRKILDIKDLRVSATCVRVPVERSHSIAINAEFNKRLDIDSIYSVLSEAKGVKLSGMPTPLKATYSKEVYVGRLRLDSAMDNALSLFVSGDQLLKGVALNAVQILNLMLTPCLR